MLKLSNCILKFQIKIFILIWIVLDLFPKSTPEGSWFWYSTSRGVHFSYQTLGLRDSWVFICWLYFKGQGSYYPSLQERQLSPSSCLCSFEAHSVLFCMRIVSAIRFYWWALHRIKLHKISTPAKWTQHIRLKQFSRQQHSSHFFRFFHTILLRHRLKFLRFGHLHECNRLSCRRGL